MSDAVRSRARGRKVGREEPRDPELRRKPETPDAAAGLLLRQVNDGRCGL